MGQMRFVIPRPERLAPGAAEQAYLASGDGIPWECRVVLADDDLSVERDTRESGYFYFPWKVTGRGLMQVYTTGSLMEQPKSHCQPAAGTGGHAESPAQQASQWQTAGMTLRQFQQRLKKPRRSRCLVLPPDRTIPRSRKITRRKPFVWASKRLKCYATTTCSRS